MKVAGSHTFDFTQMASGDPHVKADLREYECVVCSSKRGYADAPLTIPSMHNACFVGRAIASMRSAMQTCNAHRSTPMAARLAERLRTVAPPTNSRENGLSR